MSRNFGSGFPSNLYDMKATLAREWDIGYTYLLTFYFLIMGGEMFSVGIYSIYLYLCMYAEVALYVLR